MYTIKGIGLNSAQIRHMVFYTTRLEDKTDGRRQLSTRELTANAINHRKPNNNRPLHRRDDQDGRKLFKFTAPKPILDNGTVTVCNETWDFISEVKLYIQALYISYILDTYSVPEHLWCLNQ